MNVTFLPKKVSQKANQQRLTMNTTYHSNTSILLPSKPFHLLDCKNLMCPFNVHLAEDSRPLIHGYHVIMTSRGREARLWMEFLTTLDVEEFEGLRSSLCVVRCVSKYLMDKGVKLLSGSRRWLGYK